MQTCNNQWHNILNILFINMHMIAHAHVHVQTGHYHVVHRPNV